MKKFLKITNRTIKYMNKLPKLYLVYCGVHWETKEVAFTGKYKYDKKAKRYIPLVYVCNEYDNKLKKYSIMPIIYATTSRVLTWTDNKGTAQFIADAIEFSKDNNYEDFVTFRENKCKCLV